MLVSVSEQYNTYFIGFKQSTSVHPWLRCHVLLREIKLGFHCSLYKVCYSSLTFSFKKIRVQFAQTQNNNGKMQHLGHYIWHAKCTCTLPKVKSLYSSTQQMFCT